MGNDENDENDENEDDDEDDDDNDDDDDDDDEDDDDDDDDDKEDDEKDEDDEDDDDDDDDEDNLQEMSTNGLATSTPAFIEGETPAFTTASSKTNTTAITVDSENSDSSRIIFPSGDEDTVAIFAFKQENEKDAEIFEAVEETTTFPQMKDNVVKLIENVLAQRIEVEDTPIEVTTARVVVDSDIGEVTIRNIISTSDLNRASEDQTSTTTESNLFSNLQVKVESEIVQVDAGNVNGPLSLDEVIYYDDADGNEDDLEADISGNSIPEDANVENKLFIEGAEDKGDSENTTASGLTTVINGFIINKKQVVKTLDNNDIETVRTSGDQESVNIDISKENNTAENITESFMKPIETTTNADIEDLERTQEETTTGGFKDAFKLAPGETTNAPAIDAKDYATDQTERTNNLSTKNPNIVIDVVDNVLELENDDILTNEKLTPKADVIDKIVEAKNESNPEKEKKPATFPVTELLNGIYKLIQGYIPTRAEINPSVEAIQTDPKIDYSKYPDNLEYFDSPNGEPIINVHNAPRDTTPFTTPKPQNQLEDNVDFANSHTDPFQQLSAPDLTGLIPEKEREEQLQQSYKSNSAAFQSLFAIILNKSKT